MLTRRSDQSKGTAVTAAAGDNQGSRVVGVALDQGTHWKAVALKRGSSGSGKVRGCGSLWLLRARTGAAAVKAAQVARSRELRLLGGGGGMK